MIGPYLDRNIEITASADLGEDKILVMPAGTVELFGMEDVVCEQSDAETVIATFNSRGVPIPVDYEHATKYKAARGEPAPATGWINSLEWVPGRGIVGSVEWSAAAREQIRAKQYRFLSPHFDIDKATRRVDFVKAVALTNVPRICNMEALIAASLAASDATSSNQEIVTMQAQHRKKLCTVLGLGDGATDTEIVAQVEEGQESSLTDEQQAILGVEQELAFLKRTLAEAGLVEADATMKEVLDKVAEIIGKTEKSEGEGEGEGETTTEEEMASITGALGIKSGSSTEEIVATINERTAKTVPLTDFRKLESTVETLTKEREDRGVEECIASVVAEGKLNPNSKERMDWARNFATKDRKGFEEIAAGLPVLYKSGRVSSDGDAITAERATVIASAISDHETDGCGAGMLHYVNAALGEHGLEYITKGSDEAKTHGIV